jgi:hypothetical protein
MEVKDLIQKAHLEYCLRLSSKKGKDRWLKYTRPNVSQSFVVEGRCVSMPIQRQRRYLLLWNYFLSFSITPSTFY